MQRKTNEKGSLTVEATVVLPIFMISVFLVINMMNILMLHNRIQYAINASAHELASYSYVYSVTGIKSAVETIQSDGAPYTSKIDETSNNILECLDAIQNVNSVEDIDNVKETGEKSVESVKDLLSDPKGALIGVGYTAAEAGIYGAKSAVGKAAIQGLTKKYIKQGNQSEDEYLMNHGVDSGYKGLDFSGTTIYNDSDQKMVDVVVQYDINLLFFKAVIDTPKLHVVQRVSVPAWLDGDGDSPDKHGLEKAW